MSKLLTQYLDIGDAKLAYREHGSGPALILLHGNSARKEMFTKYKKIKRCNHLTIFYKQETIEYIRNYFLRDASDV